MLGFEFGGGGGGGGQNQRGYSYDGQLSQSLQSIWGPQAGALSGMYSGATGLLQQQAGQVPGAAAAAQGAAAPYMQAGVSNLADMAGGNVGPLSQYAQPNNALAAQQTAQYAQQVGQNFAREVLPGIRTSAGGVGAMGSSREALAKGVAAGDAASAIARGATDLYANQYQIGAQAAGQAGQLRLGAAGALPDAATSSYNLGMAPSQAAWAPYTAAAGVFGGPTALTTQQSMAMGEDWTQMRGQTNPQKSSWGFDI